MAALPRRPLPGRSRPAVGRRLRARASRPTTRPPCSVRCGRSPAPSNPARASMRCSCLRAATSYPSSRRCWPRRTSPAGASSSSAPGSGIIPISAATGLCSAAGTRRPIPRAGAASCSVIPRLMAARRRASPASPMTRSAWPCRCRPTRRGSASRRRSLRGRPASPASTGCSACCPTAPASAGLAILEVREGGPQVIDPAPSSFATASSY